MKNFKILSVLLLCVTLLSIFAPSGALALENPDVTANAVVLADIKSGTVFYTRNETARIDPASTTKIMTVMLAVEAIENGDVAPGDMVTATDSCTAGMDEDSSTANITSGETMSLLNLMYCAMLGSANEACNIIAEYISGSIPAFVDRMNARAAEIGCTGTRFANPHGMPDENHYTTAWDLYLITLEAQRQSFFVEICGTGYIEIPETNAYEVRRLVNTNMLLNTSSDFYYEYASGVKTGYTSAAGHCLVSTAEKGDISLLAVVMGSITISDDSMDVPQHFADSITLYEWGFNNFSYREVLRSTEIVAEIPVAMASDTDYVSLRPETPVQVLLPNDDDMRSFKNEIVIYSEQDGTELSAPISAGEALGEISVVLGGQVYGRAKLVAASSVELSKLYYLKNEITETWKKPIVQAVFWGIIVLLALYVMLIARYYILRLRHRSSVRAAKRLRSHQQAELHRRQADPPRQAPPAESFVDYQFDMPESSAPDYDDIEAPGRDFYDQEEEFSNKNSAVKGFFEDFFSG